MIITSKTNPLIKTISSLSEKKYRRELKKYIVEGVKQVRECIVAGCSIDCIVCTIEHENEFNGAVIVSDSVFKAISSDVTPQGVLAVVNIVDNPLKEPSSNCLLLDNLQDPGNLGTVIRTANAAGYSEIYLINCVDPYSSKVVKASMGGIFFVKLYIGTKSEILNILRNTPIICADMNGENIFTFNPPKKYCLCIGNEGNGISEEVLSKSTYTVKIPMCESCESLNAGVSAGIAMYILKNKIDIKK